MEQLPRRYFSREDMQKRIARFKDLKGSDGGLPDSKMPGCERTLFNVIGFQPPDNIGEGGVTSPVGAQAAQMAQLGTNARITQLEDEAGTPDRNEAG